MKFTWKNFPENPLSHAPKLQNLKKVWKNFPGYLLSHAPLFGKIFRDLPIWVNVCPVKIRLSLVFALKVRLVFKNEITVRTFVENYFKVKVFSDFRPKSAQKLTLKVFSDSRTQIIFGISEFLKNRESEKL